MTRLVLLLIIFGCVYALVLEQISRGPKHEATVIKTPTPYIDPATIETPRSIRPGLCLYQYSTEAQVKACPEETPNDTNL